MRVLVTRPAREAQRWVAHLRQRHLDALALPLIEIAPVADRRPLHAAWQRMNHYRAVMFVSGNAAQHFMAERPQPLHEMGRVVDAPESPRAWTTGPGTRDALMGAGWPPERIDGPAADSPQFDSEALWHGVHHQLCAGDRVLIVRGSDAQGQSAGRDWLAAQIEAVGAVADRVLAYERRAPQWESPQQLLAVQAAMDGSVWLFSSSEAIANLVALLPGQVWTQARAVATHPRIAQAARDAGFGVVCESRPALLDVVASIESLA